MMPPLTTLRGAGGLLARCHSEPIQDARRRHTYTHTIHSTFAVGGVAQQTDQKVSGSPLARLGDAPKTESVGHGRFGNGNTAGTAAPNRAVFFPTFCSSCLGPFLVEFLQSPPRELYCCSLYPSIYARDERNECLNELGNWVRDLMSGC